jgi:hypothetical protein
MKHSRELAEKVVNEVAEFLSSKMKEHPNLKILNDDDDGGDYLQIYYEYRDDEGNFETLASTVISC